MTLVSVEDLTIHKQSTATDAGIIVSNVTFTVHKGELVMVVGPSGAGKSSLLKVLNGLEPYTSGRILFKGQDIRLMDMVELRRQVGMVFQQALLFEGTVEENLSYGPRLQGLTDPQLWREPLAWVGLTQDYLAREISSLSGGEAQRVSLARTLANRPQVLLLDEPTAALDPVTAEKIEQLVVSLKERLGLAVIWVSHDWQQVRSRAERVLVVNKQQVREIHPSQVGERMTS